MAKIQLPLDFKEFLKSLNFHQIEYLFVGGYAVGYHGYPHATGDMDLWVEVHQHSAEQLLAVLRKFGFNTPQLSADLFLTEHQIVRNRFSQIL